VNTAWDFLVFGVGGLALPCLLLLYWIRRTTAR